MKFDDKQNYQDLYCQLWINDRYIKEMDLDENMESYFIEYLKTTEKIVNQTNPHSTLNTQLSHTPSHQQLQQQKDSIEKNVLYDEKTLKNFRKFRISYCKADYDKLLDDGTRDQLFEQHRIPILEYLNNRSNYNTDNIVVRYMHEDWSTESALKILEDYELQHTKKNQSETSLNNLEFFSAESDLEEKLSGERTVLLRKRTKNISSVILSLIQLNRGENMVDYILKNASDEIIEIRSAKLYLYHYKDKLIISDIDGTITKTELKGIITD